jgi:hypothetical protein
MGQPLQRGERENWIIDHRPVKDKKKLLEHREALQGTGRGRCR